ncbi:MAG: class I tRNA ligase family protein, partial [Bacteroidota bacterium]|nr:class I tRNA ligase family protein [Bacteroidota bacterium]
GDSCDWERERFTMDPGYVRAVQHVFVKLYEADLIYRGHYLVNWCPVDQTALSDEEVDNVEQDGHLWYIRYPTEDGTGHITVATTRPETMLGDVAVAVNSNDDRYTELVGKRVRLPLTQRHIPVIADDYVQQEFGTATLQGDRGTAIIPSMVCSHEAACGAGDHRGQGRHRKILPEALGKRIFSLAGRDS